MVVKLNTQSASACRYERANVKERLGRKAVNTICAKEETSLHSQWQQWGDKKTQGDAEYNFCIQFLHILQMALIE